jgi:FhaA, N-terminal domain/FHA domain
MAQSPPVDLGSIGERSSRQMNLLKSVESTIANLVEGAFSRMFRSEVRPMELARKLAREMDEHRMTLVSHVHAPNEYQVWLSPQDRARYEGIEAEVIDELSAYLLEHARREELILGSQPLIVFHTDERLALGEFGIQARSVRAGRHSDGVQRPAVSELPRSREAGSEGRAAQPAELGSAGLGSAGLTGSGHLEAAEEHGQTMIYSASARVRGPVEEAHALRKPTRALLAVGDRRLLLPGGGGVVGRSRDCDIVLDDAGISRHHAQIRPGPGGWTVEDLGSTNGVLVNGRSVRGTQLLHSGDHLELGSTEIVFEIG